MHDPNPTAVVLSAGREAAAVEGSAVPVHFQPRAVPTPSPQTSLSAKLVSSRVPAGKIQLTRQPASTLSRVRCLLTKVSGWTVIHPAIILVSPKANGDRAISIRRSRSKGQKDTSRGAGPRTPLFDAGLRGFADVAALDSSGPTASLEPEEARHNWWPEDEEDQEATGSKRNRREDYGNLR